MYMCRHGHVCVCIYFSMLNTALIAYVVYCCVVLITCISGHCIVLTLLFYRHAVS